MQRIARSGLAIAGVAVVLFLMGWLDGTLMRDVQYRWGQTDDPTVFVWLYTLGYLVTAAAVFAVGLAGWWGQSWTTGIVFLAGGGCVASLDVIFHLAVWGGSPLALAVNHIYQWQGGPIGALRIVGAATFLVGLVVLASMLRAWIAHPSPSQAEASDQLESIGP